MSPAEMKKKAARTLNRDPRVGASQGRVHRVTPGIVRTTQAGETDDQFTTVYYALGYVVSGQKIIYADKMTCKAWPGDIFFLNRGCHKVKYLPYSDKPFRQVLFYYTPEQMAEIIARLSIDFSINICVHHTCDECRRSEYVVSPGWPSLHHLIDWVDHALSSGVWEGDQTARSLALEALVCQIISRKEGCLRTRVLRSTDPEKELMERTLRDYVFSDITIDELARRNNRSLSSFKKKFKGYYHESPRRWVVRQRLMHARLQIVSTDKSVTMIACDCLFSSAPYFIKLFREQFGMSPTRYREKYGVFRSNPSKSDRPCDADLNKA